MFPLPGVGGAHAPSPAGNEGPIGCNSAACSRKAAPPLKGPVPAAAAAGPRRLVCTAHHGLQGSHTLQPPPPQGGTGHHPAQPCSPKPATSHLCSALLQEARMGSQPPPSPRRGHTRCAFEEAHPKPESTRRNLEKLSKGFPGGPVAKTAGSQCRAPRSDPWSGNYIPHAAINTWHSQISK